MRLSRADGRIIAAVQRSGPVTCLRSIVERLGVALEREFLRPYYGKLTFKLSAPENVHLYLTPVLMEDAMDEEKPPVERGVTVHIGADKDVVEPWTTDPTTYTVEDVLSGWYSIRLERPGYEGTGTNNSRWEARHILGAVRVLEARTGKTLESFPLEVRRFLVRVDPLSVAHIDGDQLRFTFRKKRGSLNSLVKRQYVDDEYERSDAMRTLLIGGPGIGLNEGRQVAEFTEDTMCDFFEERAAPPADYGRTYVAVGQSFNFEFFEGGELIIEDYQGETLPVGRYQMVVWAPYYQLHTLEVSVRDGDQDKNVRSSLVRRIVPIEMSTTGRKPSAYGMLQGEVTGQSFDVNLDFEDDRLKEGLPIDRYLVRTDVPGFSSWVETLDLLPETEDPPVFDPSSSEALPIHYVESMPEQSKLRFKTRLTLAGRLEALGKLNNPDVGDWHIDSQIEQIIDLLLYMEEEFHKELSGDGGFFRGWREKLTSGREPLEREGIQTEREARASDDTPETPSEERREAPPREQEAKQEAPGAGGSSEEPEQKTTKGLPRELRLLRELLAERLTYVDLLVLDGEDLDRLEDLHEVRSLLAEYVERGGALVAFTTEPGNYHALLGAPLSINEKRKRTRKFRLKPGTVKLLDLPKEKQKVREKRELPQVDLEKSQNDWRILAYGPGSRQPRILERGEQDEGGYVLIWADHPYALEAEKTNKIAKVRQQVTDRAMDWARYLMYRKYDDVDEAKAWAEERRLVRGR